MDLGTYIEINGRPAVRFVRTYNHSIERVWLAVTDPEELVHWFPSSVEIDPRMDGVITFSGDRHLAESTGKILEYDPPRRLVFTWGRDELRFELCQPVGDSCQFTLTDILEQRDTAARNGSGWSICLGELDRHIGDELTSGPHSAANIALFQSYHDAYVAVGVPYGAAIPQ